MTAYVAKPLTSANTARGLYGKESFKYDARENCYICPAGQKLIYRFATNEKGRAIYYYRASSCKSCPLKAKCTRNKENRTITRLAAEEVQGEWPSAWPPTPGSCAGAKPSSNIALAQ